MRDGAVTGLTFTEDRGCLTGPVQRIAPTLEGSNTSSGSDSKSYTTAIRALLCLKLPG